MTDLILVAFYSGSIRIIGMFWEYFIRISKQGPSRKFILYRQDLLTNSALLR